MYAESAEEDAEQTCCDLGLIGHIAIVLVIRCVLLESARLRECRIRIGRAELLRTRLLEGLSARCLESLCGRLLERLVLLQIDRLLNELRLLRKLCRLLKSRCCLLLELRLLLESSCCAAVDSVDWIAADLADRNTGRCF